MQWFRNLLQGPPRPSETFPRELTETERAALDYALAADEFGAAELREQARHVVVIGRCRCGCPAVFPPATPRELK